jgi:hypothetical protein
VGHEAAGRYLNHGWPAGLKRTEVGGETEAAASDARKTMMGSRFTYCVTLLIRINDNIHDNYISVVITTIPPL